ncbi:Phosphoribosylformylglycinamidine synthase subunit PurL [Botrimarina hoheduenensis]|uniref:Phosphoribosylformylglycinamidine synthase subunit PurL n=2 Tax=Botrimarina hoheduenensis TaxID=2528000 RepID=A0A5C5WCB7_9BACT|nr:Phosphoribosylformylglycinamidine synthase subunit PurL [Botrimarina hoheduenensis]
MLWEVDIHPAEGCPDRVGQRLQSEAAALGFSQVAAATARGFLIEGDSLSRAEVQHIAQRLLIDGVVERAVIGTVTDTALSQAPLVLGDRESQLISVLFKTGVMDPVAQSTEGALSELGFAGVRVGTLRKHWLTGISAAEAAPLGKRLLANDAIEQLVVGPLSMTSLAAGSPYRFELRRIAILDLDDAGLERLSREGQLYLQLEEMRTIQRYFQEQRREPTDIELESLAQTWSEHCSHKTLAGRIAYRDEQGERHFDNMLKETIFAATLRLREQWGENDWCESVFKDNAGVVRFDEVDNVCFKVETHNHPSALEPYGGANTGLGGVLRDTLGTGLGAKPVCSTDVFCFAPPDTPDDQLPAGVLAPRRVMRGVVEGVRDYGNRMGVPTVNGAVCYDERYLGNPLVYCGNVGLLPREKTHKQPRAGDLIVAAGGRTGRDGIHGATFSSAELTSESESLSGGAVQIGNAIEEKKLTDVLLQARDRGLYTAVTDCGAGGFSSAVGEMGEGIGAEVELAWAPLKYAGLSYTEIWISEAQERMVFSVPEEKCDELITLFKSEGVEATVIGRFVDTGNLTLKYDGQDVGELPMEFLHNGRPPVVRQARYSPVRETPFAPHHASADRTEDLLQILSAPNVASKASIIRQYDHEVQGGSVVKPLVGVGEGGPSDAAVVRPKLNSRRGLAIACGINPRYGDHDTYRMAASAIDEAIRNCVAVGADPARIALLDNFCWGDCEKPDTLGSLVRAALACHDLSLAFDAPFVSGKDSLNNEFRYESARGERVSIAIPPTLLISAMGQVADVSRCVTMDLKRAGNKLYLLGATRCEFGGSHLGLVTGVTGGVAPAVYPAEARATFTAVHRAIGAGMVAACHDCSEGGVAVALAEMALAGGLGVTADLSALPLEGDFESADQRALAALFSESNSRFVCEVAPEHSAAWEALLEGVFFAAIGHVTEADGFTIATASAHAIGTRVPKLDEAWRGGPTL